MKIILVVGARPNFMKIAPLNKILAQRKDVNAMIVHTGQHYDKMMSDVFLKELELPNPQYHLGVCKGSPSERLANVILKFEEVVKKEKPNLIVVVGDVNSTLAAALTASKTKTPLAHIEAGLRSFDKGMPEENNRILTDHLSDFLFVSEKSGLENLVREGIAPEKIHFVGNLMIDNLIHYLQKSKEKDIISKLGLEKGSYVLTTMHRPSNVDKEDKLRKVVRLIQKISEYKKVVFPIHPRTLKRLKEFRLEAQLKDVSNLILTAPLSYLSFLNLMSNALAVITDSGGIQEETTYLNVPCITLRNSTERPVTVEQGSNSLVPNLDIEKVLQVFESILTNTYKKGNIPELWDDQSARRVAEVILN